MLCDPPYTVAVRRWLVLCLVMLAPPAAASDQHWLIVEVIDGDTLRVQVGDALERVRVIGVDTPELHDPGCAAELQAATEAKAFAAAFVARVPAIFHPQGRDRYGRILATVTVAGEDLAAALIAAGLGRPYDGGKRSEWC